MSYLADVTQQRLEQSFASYGMSLEVYTDYVVVENSQPCDQATINERVNQAGFMALQSAVRIAGKAVFTLCPYRLPAFFTPLVNDASMHSIMLADRNLDLLAMNEALANYNNEHKGVTWQQLEAFFRINHCFTYLIARQPHPEVSSAVRIEFPRGKKQPYHLFISTRPAALARQEMLEESASYEENFAKLSWTGLMISNNSLPLEEQFVEKDLIIQNEKIRQKYPACCGDTKAFFRYFALDEKTIILKSDKEYQEARDSPSDRLAQMLDTTSSLIKCRYYRYVNKYLLEEIRELMQLQPDVDRIWVYTEKDPAGVEMSLLARFLWKCCKDGDEQCKVHAKPVIKVLLQEGAKLYYHLPYTHTLFPGCLHNLVDECKRELHQDMRARALFMQWVVKERGMGKGMAFKAQSSAYPDFIFRLLPNEVWFSSILRFFYQLPTLVSTLPPQ